MATVDNELDSLLNRIDDLFAEIPLSEPISHYNLEEDRARLALISRTTLSWFKSLSEPPLTDEGLDVDQTSDESILPAKCNILKRESPKPEVKARRINLRKSGRSSRVRQVKPDSSLDTLARDLERLLEDNAADEVEHKDEQEIFFHSIHSNDEDALRDSTIGYSCSFDENCRITDGVANENLTSRRDNEEKFLVVMRSLDTNNDREESVGNLRVLTPMPTDHEYITRPRRNFKLLTSNEKLLEPSRQERALNMDTLKKFARFSDKFRVLIDC